MLRHNLLVHEILEAISASMHPEGLDLEHHLEIISKDSWSKRVPEVLFRYNLNLLLNNGFVTSDMGNDGQTRYHLTWDGHDLYDDLSNDFDEDEGEEAEPTLAD